MRSILLKDNVCITNLQPLMCYALIVAARCFWRRGYDIVVTSGRDGKHRADSLHPEGLAVDLRSKNVKDDEKIDLLHEIQDELGLDYDCLIEDIGMANEHFHLEWDPS